MPKTARSRLTGGQGSARLLAAAFLLCATQVATAGPPRVV